MALAAFADGESYAQNASPVAGSYRGPVLIDVGSGTTHGKMGLQTDSLGDGSFSLEVGGNSISRRFAPPFSAIDGDRLTVKGVVPVHCAFALTARAEGGGTPLKGDFTVSCPGKAPLKATFALPRGPYVSDPSAREMTSF